MNSLVVFLSVVAFVAGKPSGLITSPIISTPLAYAAPAYYSAPALYSAPAAVSSQSRLDIKSSPAVVTTSIEPIARTVISEPAIVAPPSILPAAIAPAAVSSQSRIDIKSSPAITSTVISAPVAYSAPLALAYKAPTFVKTFAPAFSAAIAEPAVPLDTPEVIAARAEHFEAKALAAAHLIKKRSASLIAAPVLSHLASPVISTYAAAPVVHAAPLAYSAPVAFSTPLITKAYSVHPW
ncbi:calphotin-like [Spodoptera litura]|uniref:Calphotin-like n=1 Tax=Spodoptera litura TaxID=69820 RepID=A0A4U7BAK7_SPOLT|nr:calphotin-like [Spodoptera litura]TKX27969.1 cuticular protein CPH [Spodoptera litura]